jgi:two-component system cell cycle sensor histidine kinase/response regulator CckA
MVLKVKVPYSVLIIDDDDDIVELLKQSFEDLSITVHTAKDGRLALNFLANYKVDCLIVDVVMPNMTGPELIAELQKQNDPTPFFFITGYLDSSREDLNSLKPRAIIFKPFDFEEAAILVKNHLMRIS